jgi:hypothetical protein
MSVAVTVTTRQNILRLDENKVWRFIIFADRRITGMKQGDLGRCWENWSRAAVAFPFHS